MICRLRSNTVSIRARLSTLVATEEFPFKDVLTPKPSTPATIKSNKLANGIQTISRDYNSKIVSLKFAVVGGSSSESTSNKGAAHFLSTAAFAGNNTNSGLRMVRFLESLGASFDSYSDKEKIVYDVKVLPDKADQAIAAVLAAIASPPHAAYVLDEIRATTELDYNKFAVDYSAQLQELVHEAAYGETSPLGASKFASSLKKLSVPAVLQYRAATFVRGNLVVAANGISQERLEALLNAGAASIPEGPAAVATSSSYVGGDVKVRTDLSGVSHLALAFPVPAGDAAKPYVVLKALLAAKLASQKVCATAFLTSFSQGGLLGVEAVGQPSAAAAQLEAVVAELKAIAAKCPEIEVLKQKVTLDYFLTLEGGNTTCTLLSAQLRGQNPATAGDVRSVTAESVSAAAAAALKSNPSYAVLGATAGTPSFATIANLLK